MRQDRNFLSWSNRRTYLWWPMRVFHRRQVKTAILDTSILTPGLTSKAIGGGGAEPNTGGNIGGGVAGWSVALSGMAGIEGAAVSVDFPGGLTSTRVAAISGDGIGARTMRLAIFAAHRAARRAGGGGSGAMRSIAFLWLVLSDRWIVVPT